jgi:hypothetical protein
MGGKRHVLLDPNSEVDKDKLKHRSTRPLHQQPSLDNDVSGRDML